MGVVIEDDCGRCAARGSGVGRGLTVRIGWLLGAVRMMSLRQSRRWCILQSLQSAHSIQKQWTTNQLASSACSDFDTHIITAGHVQQVTQPIQRCRYTVTARARIAAFHNRLYSREQVDSNSLTSSLQGEESVS